MFYLHYFDASKVGETCRFNGVNLNEKLHVFSMKWWAMNRKMNKKYFIDVNKKYREAPAPFLRS